MIERIYEAGRRKVYFRRWQLWLLLTLCVLLYVGPYLPDAVGGAVLLAGILFLVFMWGYAKAKGLG